MPKCKAVVLLLACFLLSTIMGLAQAQESPVTLTTDKTTYNPGEAVIVTVTFYGSSFITSASVEIVPVPFPACGYTCPTASGTVNLNPVVLTAPPWNALQGAVVLQLLGNTPAGHYDVGIVYCPDPSLNNGQPTCNGQYTLFQGAEVGILVT
jgi:hypothetical protein